MIVFVQFADLALAKEISRSGRSTYILYYLAVRHYLSQQYKEALLHLREAECTYGLVCLLFLVSVHFCTQQLF